MHITYYICCPLQILHIIFFITFLLYFLLLFLLLSPSDNMERMVYCQVTVTNDVLKAFTYAIRNQYSYQMYIGKNNDDNDD